jgi:hypothetical protein
MFVFGSSLNAGISGTNINLSEAIAGNNFQIQTVQHDYRRVFSTILQDWFGVSNPTLDLTFYDHTNNIGFAGNKISNLINTQNSVPPFCYNDVLLSTNSFNHSNEVIVYPNPSTETVSINSTSTINDITIYTIDGKLIGTYRNPLTSNNFTINVESLSIGMYSFKINTVNGSISKKVIIRR